MKVPSVFRALPFLSADTAHRPAILKLVSISPGAVFLSNMAVADMIKDLFAEYGEFFPQLPPGGTFGIIKGKKTLGPKLYNWILNECDKL